MLYIRGLSCFGDADYNSDKADDNQKKVEAV